MPVRVKFDAYHAKEDGYLPYGYQFTITDPNHPAYQGTFVVLDLNPETIKAKFDRIASQYKIVTRSSDLPFVRLANTTRETTYESEHDPETGDYVRANFAHSSQIMEADEIIYDLDPKVGTVRIPFGARKTDINWELYDKDGNASFDRVFAVDEDGNQHLTKTNRDQGVGVMLKIRDMVRALLNNEYMGAPPHVITFQSVLGDSAKTIRYIQMAERFQRKYGWNFHTTEHGFYLVDPNMDITPQDIQVAKTLGRKFGTIADDIGPDYATRSTDYTTSTGTCY